MHTGMHTIVCMKKERVTLTIDPDVRAELERTGNSSDYITRAIRERLDAAASALRTLRLDGWRSTEVLAAANALLGFDFARYGSDGRLVAAELERAAIERQVSGDDLGSWRPRIESVRNDASIAHALCLVVGELRLGNEAVARSVGVMFGALRLVGGVQFVGVRLDVQVVDAGGNVITGPYEVERGQRLDLGFAPLPLPLSPGQRSPNSKRFRFAIDGEEKWGFDVDPDDPKVPWFEYRFFVRE